MAIQFDKVVFKNLNSIDVSLTVEAPIGTQVSGPTKVKANSTATITPGVSNCRSVLLHAYDSAHHAKQTYELAAPKSGEGRPAYLQAVEVEYRSADFEKAKLLAGVG